MKRIKKFSQMERIPEMEAFLRAKIFVRQVVIEDFGQSINEDAIERLAEKVMQVIPRLPKRTRITK